MLQPRLSQHQTRRDPAWNGRHDRPEPRWKLSTGSHLR